MLNSETLKTIEQMAEELRKQFTPPEYIPGCVVKSVADKDIYATDNGWIEAVAGQHNQQRCRWRGQFSSVAVDDVVDVFYYPSFRLFVVASQGGSGAARPPAAGGGGYPFNTITVDATDSDADYSTLTAAIAAASSGDTILVGPGTYTCDDETLPDGVDLVGMGPGITVLSTTTESICLTPGTGCEARGFSVSNTSTGSAAYAIQVISDTGVTLENIVTSTVGATDNAYGIYGFGAGLTIKDCIVTASGATVNQPLITTDSSATNVYGGRFTGDDVQCTSSSVINLWSGVTLAVDTITSTGGTVNGQYFDSDGVLQPIASGGAWPEKDHYWTIISGTVTDYASTTISKTLLESLAVGDLLLLGLGTFTYSDAMATLTAFGNGTISIYGRGWGTHLQRITVDDYLLKANNSTLDVITENLYISSFASTGIFYISSSSELKCYKTAIVSSSADEAVYLDSDAVARFYHSYLDSNTYGVTVASGGGANAKLYHTSYPTGGNQGNVTDYDPHPSASGGFLVGEIKIWPFASLPSAEWLWCDGSVATVGTWPLLNAALIADGYPFGGSGASPLIPDTRGRGVIAPDNMGGTSANIVTDANADAIGGIGGAETVTLTTPQIPSHDHTFPSRTSSGAGTRPATQNSGTFVTASTSSTGGGGSHSNMQPWLALPLIIYGGS